MRKVILSLAAMALALVMASGIALAAGAVLDQSQTKQNSTEVVDSSGDFQRFTAEKSGKLEKVELYVGCCDPTGTVDPSDVPSLLYVQVADRFAIVNEEELQKLQNDQGKYDGRLDWVTIDSAVDTWYEGYQRPSSPPLVEAGQEYSIVLSARNEYGFVAPGPYYLWGYYDNQDDEDIYPDGQMGVCRVVADPDVDCFDTDDDGTFKTHVIPTPVETTITSGPASATNSTSAEFKFSADPAEDATFECRLNVWVSSSYTYGDWEPCTSPETYDNLSQGFYQFEVRASGPEGTDFSPAVHNWRVDTTPPGSTTITTPIGLPVRPYTGDTATFTFSGPNELGISFRCRLDGGAWEHPCGTQNPSQPSVGRKTYGPDDLSEGRHTFEVAAVDSAGNANPTPASRTWTVDATDPTTTAKITTLDSSGNTIDYESGTPTNKDVTVTLEAEDTGDFVSGVASISYSTDGGKTYTRVFGSSTTLSTTFLASEGQTDLKYFASDRAGNSEDPPDEVFTIKLDKTGPSVDPNISPTPKDGETDVSRSIKEVKATFSEPLDPKTVSTEAKTVQLFSGSSKNPLKAQVSLSGDGKTVTLTPPQKLDAKTKYTVKISDGVKDLAGNALAPYTWSFTTGSQ